MNRAPAPAETLANPRARISAAKRSQSLGNGLACTLAVAACLFVSYPVAEIGFIDDWSYIETALKFAHTGHFLYQGWAVEVLGWWVAWGALFIKIFGFSFTAVRASAWLVALASVFLFHRVLVRFDIASRDAAFGTLALGLSPLFFPLAASYMTDVPGLFVIIVCIYMCQRSVAAATDRRAVVWLCSAALVNVAGGTVRQIAWLGALVMVPSTAWLLRRRRGMLPAGVAAWVASLVGVFGCMHWFSEQPYAESESLIAGAPIHIALFLHLAMLIVRTLLCLLFVLLPLLVAWLPAVRRLSFKARARIIASLVVASVAMIVLAHFGRLDGSILPWISHMLMQLGMSPAPGFMLGSTPAILAVWARIAISLIVIAVGLVFAEELFSRGPLGKISSLGKQDYSWRNAAWILGPFVISYLGLLLPRGIHGLIFDRYLLGPMIVAIVVLLKLYEQEFSAQISGLSWFVLAVLSVYTIAATHDWFALNRARVVAANEIRASGIPRTSIQGGLEYDGWTQIQDGRHINNPFVEFPKGAYDPALLPPPMPPGCSLGYTVFIPDVRPKYFLTLEKMDCLSPSNFPAVNYRAWLPPFDRTVFIQQLPAASK